MKKYGCCRLGRGVLAEMEIFSFFCTALLLQVFS